MNWNNIVGMIIAGVGTIALCLNGNINGDAATGLLGAILGYAFGFTNGVKGNNAAMKATAEAMVKEATKHIGETA